MISITTDADDSSIDSMGEIDVAEFNMAMIKTMTLGHDADHIRD